MMTDSLVPVSPTPADPDLVVDYLLRELEFQVMLETKARDRMENMVQYLLTTIAAVIGAALLVSELQVNTVLLLFIASFLLFVLSTSAFYRACRLRYITTYARANRNNIRCTLLDMGVRAAEHLIQWEGNPSGFSPKMMLKLVLLLILSSLLGGLTGLFFLLFLYQVRHWPAIISSLRIAFWIGIPILLSASLAGGLSIVLKNQKANAEQFISDPEWRSLPDYDL